MMEVAAVIIIIGTFAIDRLVRSPARVVHGEDLDSHEIDHDARPR